MINFYFILVFMFNQSNMYLQCLLVEHVTRSWPSLAVPF